MSLDRYIHNYSNEFLDFSNMRLANTTTVSKDQRPGVRLKIKMPSYQ